MAFTNVHLQEVIQGSISEPNALMQVTMTQALS